MFLVLMGGCVERVVRTIIDLHCIYICTHTYAVGDLKSKFGSKKKKKVVIEE